MTKAEGAAPRKPMGVFWLGGIFFAEEMLKQVGLTEMKRMWRWLGQVIAWAEHQRKERRK